MWPLNEEMRNLTGFTVITLVFLVGGIVLIANNHTVPKNARKTFLICLVSVFFITAFDWLNYVCGTSMPEFRWFHILTNAVTFAIAPALPAAISQTLFPDKRFKVVVVILVAHALLELATIFGGFVFSVDEANVYTRGPLYPVYIATYVMSSIYLSVRSIHAGATYQSANLGSILIILLTLAVGVSIQIYDGTIRTTWPAVSMTIVLDFLFYADMILRTDALTKLLNRHGYQEFLHHPPLPCEVVLIDVDSFKQVNDTYGHAFGDECLTTEAALIRRAFGSAGLCYRTGGDEFTVVVTKRLDEVDAMTSDLASLVAKAQEKEPRLPTLSVGHARAEVGTGDINTVIEAADQEMSETKRLRKAGRAA